MHAATCILMHFMTTYYAYIYAADLSRYGWMLIPLHLPDEMSNLMICQARLFITHVVYRTPVIITILTTLMSRGGN